jgi:DNA-binding CsgD family transcriptional regulator
MSQVPFSLESQDWLCWLLRAEGALGALSEGDDYALYELMHHQAALLAPVEACYVCLYRPKDDALFFSYNFDGEFYDEPLTVPLGNGPTSWVVREGAPFILNPHNEALHNARINFGDGARISRSALHLPLSITKPCGRREILGVFSVQSYRAGAYDEATISALQLWCDRVALHLHHRHLRRAHQIELHEAHAQLKAAQAHQIRMADHFMELLRPLARQVQEMSQNLKADTPLSRADLQGQIEALRRNCHSVQTQANQLPLASGSGVSDVSAEDEFNPLTRLSRGELEVLRLLATGSTNSQIASTIGRSVNTAKKHCAGIYRKLGARNRTEAAQVYARYAASTKNIQTGNSEPT